MTPLPPALPALAAREVELRARYLVEVLTTLYPAPCSLDDTATDNPVLAEFVAVPDARRPRLLVPTGSRRLAATAVRRHAGPPTRTARLKRDLTAAALRTGVSDALLRDRLTVCGPSDTDTINGYLRRMLGRDLALSVHIGPARANRKPVLQLLTPPGETVGFAKLGVNALTDRLVRLEVTALTTLAATELSNVVTPRVLHAGQWRGHQILVQEALPTWRPRRPVGPRLPRAMREVAHCLGVTRGPLVASPYWKGLREQLDEVATTGEGRALSLAADLLVARAGDTRLEFGAWHGDWVPRNMAAQADTVLVWDWARFTPGVPVGFDAAHYELQVRLERGERVEPAVDAMLARCDLLLSPFDVPPGPARVTALLYLVDLAARYLADGQAEAGARLGVLGGWLLPVLVRRVEEL
jgi:hypothetical protein